VKVLVLGAGPSKSADYPPFAGELMTTIEQDVRESRNAQPARSLGQVEGIDATNALERGSQVVSEPPRIPQFRPGGSVRRGWQTRD
jgi:hypothetical protein